MIGKALAQRDMCVNCKPVNLSKKWPTVTLAAKWRGFSPNITRECMCRGINIWYSSLCPL